MLGEQELKDYLQKLRVMGEDDEVRNNAGSLLMKEILQTLYF